MTAPEAPPADRFPLSFNQEFLCMMGTDETEGSFGPRHNIVCAWRIRGTVRSDVLQGALDAVVVRHEALRTSIVVAGDEQYQQVHEPAPVQLSELDLGGVAPADRDSRIEDLLIEVEGGRYGVGELPLLRGILGRFDEDDSVLLLVAHHAAVDEWSVQVLIRDLAAEYANLRGFDVPVKSAPQYRDFAAWQREAAAARPAERRRTYWREKMAGGEILATKTDHLRSEGIPKNTAVHRFVVDQDATAAAIELAKASKSSPFMVLLAVYEVLLNERTAATDLVVPTLAAGRGQAQFHATVGSFMNFLPLRTDIAGCTTFREVVDRTRRSCLEAYSRELPFGHVMAEAPSVVNQFGSDDRAPIAFQVFQYPFVLSGERIGDLEYSNLRRRMRSQGVSTDIPDGALFQLDIDAAGDMIGFLGYNSNLFDEASMLELVEDFRKVLVRTVGSPDAPLALR
jgi:hypothetical protein